MHNQGTISGMGGIPRKSPLVLHEETRRYKRHKCYNCYKPHRKYQPICIWTNVFLVSILETDHHFGVFQGESFCMGERPARKPGIKHSLSFVFVNTDDGYKRPHLVSRPEPWWLRCRRWLQYHAIQVRWDIERRLARLFKRRWGG